MADDFDMRFYRSTWHRFTKMLTYSATGIVILLILMALFLL
jgi:hypothetical protein